MVIVFQYIWTSFSKKKEKTMMKLLYFVDDSNTGKQLGTLFIGMGPTAGQLNHASASAICRASMLHARGAPQYKHPMHGSWSGLVS
jgi:hypothetical protein